MSDKKHPYPLFDQAEHLAMPLSTWHQAYLKSLDLEGVFEEYDLCKRFLLAYRGSEDTFKSYRRDVERLCQWSWIHKQRLLKTLNRNDFTEYFHFVQSPLKSWVAIKHSQRYQDHASGQRLPVEHWRPFLLRKSIKNKTASDTYSPSQASLRACIACVSTFCTYLMQENYIPANPVLLIRQKSQFLQKVHQERITRKLSNEQWRILVKTIQYLAEKDHKYERHVFVISAFYLLGLRISELSSSEKYHPKMADFFRDNAQRWWFKTVGKGNKYREIAMPNAMVDSLKRYRAHLQLSALPTPFDQSPIIPKHRGHGGIGIRQLRKVVQEAFDAAITQLKKQGSVEEATLMQQATAHWLRHTAISHDVQHRPREHVRDDAGHGSATVTDRYIETDLAARHSSARDKRLILDLDITNLED